MSSRKDTTEKMREAAMNAVENAGKAAAAAREAAEKAAEKAAPRAKEAAEIAAEKAAEMAKAATPKAKAAAEAAKESAEKAAESAMLSAGKAADNIKAVARKSMEKNREQEIRTFMRIQFSDRDYAQGDLFQMAREVWIRDLGRDAEDLESIDLYVKPEESKVYYVMNGDKTGSFDI